MLNLESNNSLLLKKKKTLLKEFCLFFLTITIMNSCMHSAFLFLDDWMVYTPLITILPHISIWHLSSVVTHWHPSIPRRGMCKSYMINK